MEDLKIRIAVEEDAEELLNIYEPYIRNTAITFEYEVPSVEEFRARIRQVKEKYPYLVAERDGVIVGYAYVGAFKERAAYNWAVETSIYVRMGLKRQGVGYKLYKILEDILKAQGILNVNACIAYPETEDEYLTKDSVKFHEKLGHRMVGEFHQCGYKFGRWYNMVWMEKNIGEHLENQPDVKWWPEIEGEVFLDSAPPICTGTEDKFYYVISDRCVMCGACAEACPVSAVTERDGMYAINPELCIDCGTCSGVCPAGAAYRIPYMRNSISVNDIDKSKCYFNPGCALDLYKPDIANRMLKLLQEKFGEIKPHHICCRHNPELSMGATIINNCAGCDRRFRSLYEGISTISFWEVLDSMEGLVFPDYGGVKMSVHDPCGYRHKPQVHRAVRNILRKMNIEIVEAEFHGSESICCGDNFYGYVPNECVQKRIQMRAEQFPCRDVVVYCIGCERAMKEGGKTPHYLPELLFEQISEPNIDTLDEYHQKIALLFKSSCLK